MGTLDYIVLGLVFVLAVADVIFIIRSRKKKGNGGEGCCGDCSRCSSVCSEKDRTQEDDKK